MTSSKSSRTITVQLIDTQYGRCIGIVESDPNLVDIAKAIEFLASFLEEKLSPSSQQK